MLDRRALLTAGAAAIATSLVPKNCSLAATPAVNQESEAIDAHVHVWTSDLDRYPLAKGYRVEEMSPKSFTPEELFAHSRPNGVGRIVLVQMNFYEFDNRYMLDTIERHPSIFSGVGIVDENRGDLLEGMRAMRERGVLGFRLYAQKENVSRWKNSTGMHAMWKHGADLGQAMCLLANPDALADILLFAKQYPKTRVVIDHFARIGVDGEIRPKDVDQLLAFSQLENVYVKTSAFYALGKKKPPYEDLGEMISKLVREFGSRRLMWASDCPYQVDPGHSYRESIELIRTKLSFLTSEDKSNLLSKTAERVFFG